MWTIYIRRPCSALRCLFFDGVGSLWIRSLNHYYSQCQIFNKYSIFLSLQLSTLHIARLWTEKKKKKTLSDFHLCYSFYCPQVPTMNSSSTEANPRSYISIFATFFFPFIISISSYSIITFSKKRKRKLFYYHNIFYHNSNVAYCE